MRKAPSVVARAIEQRIASTARAASISVTRKAPNQGGVTTDGGMIGWSTKSIREWPTPSESTLITSLITTNLSISK